MTKLASVVNGQLSDASQLNQLIALNTGGQIYDVKNGYGAVGDGVTDDTAAINSAITAANAAGGGTVYLPPGTYYLGSGPLFNASSAINNIWLRGAGRGATTLKANGALTGGTADLIRFVIPTSSAYAQNIAITDMTLDCSAATAGNGMTLQGVNFLRLQRITVNKAWGFGIVWGTIAGGTPWIVKPYGNDIICLGCGRGAGNDSWGGGGITDGLIEGYWCGDAADTTAPGGTAWDNTNVDGFVVKNAYARSAGTPPGGAFMSDFGAVGLTLRDIRVSGWQYGALIASTSSGQAKDITIDGLHVETVRSIGVFFNVTAGFGIQKFRIVNSHFDIWDTLAGANPAINVDGGHDGIITGNTFGAVTTAYAIRFRGDAGSTTLNPPTQVLCHGNDVSQPSNTIFPQLIDPNGTVRIFANPGYNAGVGVAGIAASYRNTGLVAAVANAIAFTPPTVAGSYRLHIHYRPTATGASTSVGVTVTYKDSTGAITLTTLPFIRRSASTLVAPPFLNTGADDFFVDFPFEIDNSGTNITVSTTGTFTGTTYNFAATLEQLA